MKWFLPLTVFCWLIFFDVASAQTASSFVSGKITEETTGLPLEFVNVTLMHPNDSSIIKGAVTDRKGNFKLDSIAAGTYYLRISFIGFETIETPAFTLQENKGTDMGIISLKISEILLKDVDVTAEKSAFVNSIDRKVYYPEKDLQAQTGSAGDVLENIPSVSVDVDGVVSLRGSSNVTFLINGKPSGLLTTNPENALQQIPASLIERIEIITNPSAKYKPDGTAGIINIVLKKDFKPGFNGTVSANTSTHNRYNGNVTMNYNPGKLNVYGNYGMRRNYYPRTLTDSRIEKDSLGAEETFFELNNAAVGKPFSHTANAGADYSLNTRNKIGLSGNYFNFHQKRIQDISTLEKNNVNFVISDYQTDRTEVEDEYEWEAQAYFEHTFAKKEHTIQLETSYVKFDELEDNRYNDTYFIPVSPQLTGHNLIHKSGSNSILVCEYANPIGEDMELEAGYEGEYSRGDLDFKSEIFDESQSVWIPEADKTNLFKYQQDIHAGYATFSIDIEDWGILAGIRAEQTNISSNLVTLDSVIPNNYFKLFPTVHLSYETGDNQKIGLSYSRRVNRPDPDEMNPFPEYTDPRNIESGNPYLKPEQIHSVELGYEFKKNNFSFIPGLYYRYTYDAFAEITRYVNDSILLTTFDNLANEQSAGLELVLAWNYKKMMNVNFSSNIFYNTLDASNIDYAENNSTVSWDSKLGAVFNLTPTTRLQMNTNYRSSMLTAQGKSLPLYFINSGVRQDILRKRASLTLTVSDVFNTMKWEYEIDTDELYQKVTRKRKSQIVYVGFVWRFGISTKKSTEELQFEDKM